jgi:hypothetical protein
MSDKPGKFLGWYDRIKGFFAPFKPEIKDVSLNHKTRSCEMIMKVSVPNGVRRKFAKIEVPAYEGFRVKKMIDETLSPIPQAFHLEGGNWKFNTRTLPSSENFLITLVGALDPQAVNELIRVQPAKNRDQTEELDRYWLDSMIRDVQALEDLWKYLLVDEVNVAVNVSIEKCFAATLPFDLQERMAATANYLEAGKTLDRQKQQAAWFRYHRAASKVDLRAEAFLNVAKEFVRTEDFYEFVSVDNLKGPPYAIGEIQVPPPESPSYFPNQVLVDAVTSLDSKNYQSTGYLNFKKKQYTENVRNLLKDIGL